jgi:EAL domain-containing protein (putative c-di-GMP-specific phosphodiesterase class I)
LLRKFTAARAAARNSVAPAPTLVPSSGPATVESLGQQLREVLPTRRLQSVSLCDHEANVLWLSEGALGPDEHMLVMEALDILNADSSLPCHETALEDGRLGVFLPVRAPTGSLVGVAMILADSKSVGDDTLERMTASPVRTIMQRLAVLLKPNGLVATGTMPIPVDLPEDAELPELALAVPAEAAAPEAAAPAHVVAPVEDSEAELVENAAAELELALVSEMEVAQPPPPPPASASEPEEICETIITAAEIANILELSLVPDELPHAASSAPAPALAPQPPAPTRAAPKPSAPVAVAAPAAVAAPPPVPVAAPAASSAPIEVPIADSGMLRLEFLAEPPVVRPPPNPTALARKLQAASKAAEVAPTRAPRALPTAPPPRGVPAPTAAAPPAAAAKGKAPIAAAPPARTAATAAPPVVAPAAQPAPAAPAAARPAMQGSGGPVRNPFEPIPPNSRLSLDVSDDVVVLFEAEPVSVPARSGVPPKVAPPAQTAAAAKPAPAKAAAPAPTRPAAPARITPPPRSAPAVRNAPPPRPAPAARAPVAPAPAPAPAAAPAPSPAPPPSPAAPAPVSAAPAPVAATAISVEASPQIDLIPFAKLRAGGQNRRFQVQPRSPANRDSAAVDEQTLQQLFAWLAGQRALWSTVPTSFTVNLSVATLEDERFLTRIGAALNTHGISPDTLGFEIAETLCAQQRAKVERFIAQCEKLGAWIAIDDFSFDSQVLPLLRSKALRLLKLDARLTAAALRDKLSQAMVVATVQAAKVLGIHCSAKKADSQASLQYLTAIGLDYAQGAALARAVPLEAIGTISDARPSGVVEDSQ